MPESELEPRIARTRSVVLAATIEVVAERGFAGATIEAIAQRAGVARSTIYRNWPTRVELLLEAVGTEIGQVAAFVTGDLRGDLVALLSHLAELLTSEQMGSVAAALILESRHDQDLEELRTRFVAQRHQALEDVMREAISHGLLPAGTDERQAVDDLSAGVFFRALVLRAPIDREWVEQQVDHWLDRYGATR